MSEEKHVTSSMEDLSSFANMKLHPYTTTAASAEPGGVPLALLTQPTARGGADPTASSTSTSTSTSTSFSSSSSSSSSAVGATESSSSTSTSSLSGDTSDPSSVVVLNVGGQLFHTTMATLTKTQHSIFPIMFSGRFRLALHPSDGSVFIDRDPTYFRYILNYLRDDWLPVAFLSDLELHCILREAHYYQVLGLCELVETHLRRTAMSRAKQRTSEKETRVVDIPAFAAFSRVSEMVGKEFELEKSIPSMQGSVCIFTKPLSQGDVNLLDKLADSM